MGRHQRCLWPELVRHMDMLSTELDSFCMWCVPATHMHTSVDQLLCTFLLCSSFPGLQGPKCQFQMLCVTRNAVGAG